MAYVIYVVQTHVHDYRFAKHISSKKFAKFHPTKNTAYIYDIKYRLWECTWMIMYGVHFYPSLKSSFFTSLMSAYEDKNNLVVPLVKLTPGSVL